jgi:hypothetical protein
MSHVPGRANGSILTALLTSVLCACVPAASLPATCHDPSVHLAATLADEHLEPATFDVCRNQQVTITFTIERNGILHLHGYDDLLDAREVRAGQKTDFTFEAAHAGQFPVALHTTDGPAEVTVGTLTVNEP